MPHARSRDARGSVRTPRSVRVSHDCFLHQPGNSRRGVCQPAAPRTLADPASSPRSIRRLSPRARRSAPSSVISRYVSASRREPPNLPPPRPDMFLPPGVLSVSQEEPDGGLSGSFRAAAPRDARATPIPRAAARGGEPRVPASAPIRRGARITRASPPALPRVFTLARWTRSGGVSRLDTAQIGVRSATRRSFRCDVAVSADFFL